MKFNVAARTPDETAISGNSVRGAGVAEMVSCWCGRSRSVTSHRSAPAYLPLRDA